MECTQTEVLSGERTRTYCDKCRGWSARPEHRTRLSSRGIRTFLTSSSRSSSSSPVIPGSLREMGWWAYAMTTVVLLLALHTHGCVGDPGPQSAPTFTSQDFAGLNKFQFDGSNGGTQYYRYMVIHGEYVYVGAMDYLFRLNKEDISLDRHVNVTALSEIFPNIEDNQDACVQTQNNNKDFICRNHIRGIVVNVNRSHIYLCGTGAFRPQDVYLDIDDLRVATNLQQPGETMAAGSGTAKCPFDPEDSSTLVYVQEGNPGKIPSIYTGTSTDSTQSNPLIYRPALFNGTVQLYELLRTLPHNAKWLNEPNFVGSFDIQDYVYFFFREVSVEHPYEGKIVYSRVARVCKKDQGGSSVLEGSWTTYLKARWECSIPGDTPFSFNHIQDVVYADQQKIFYGVFTTNTPGLYGSAVCKLNLTVIEDFFNTGNFQEQLDATKLWQKVPDNRVPKPRPGNCSEDSKAVPGYVLQFIMARPLMYKSITQGSALAQPLYDVQSTTFLRIAVQKLANYTLLFLATDNGEIHKVVQWVDGSIRTNLVAIWKPFDDSQQIQQLKIQGNQLYASTDNAVRQFDVRQCSMYAKCTSCIRDPHCGWDSDGMKCKDWRDGLTQDIAAGSPLKTCGPACQIHEGPYLHSPIIRGEGLRLTCASNCEPATPVVWWNGSKELTMDSSKHLLGQDNSLMFLSINESDTAIYTCKSDGVDLTTHDVTVRACTDLAINDEKYMECVWREEFDKWCHAFEDYRKDYNKWTDLKDKCTGDGERCYIDNRATNPKN